MSDLLERCWRRVKAAVVAAFAVRSRQVLLFAAIVGALTGLGVAFFETIVVEVILDRLLDLPVWALALMPTVGLVIAALSLRVLGSTTPGRPTPTSKRSTTRSRAWSCAPSRPACWRRSARSGSAARWGSKDRRSTSALHRRRRAVPVPSTVPFVDHRVLMVAGAAAGVAAIFKAPATGAVFALEVPYQDDFARKMLLPALVAAASGYLAFVAIHGTAALVPSHGSPPLSAADLIGSVVLGLALVSSRARSRRCCAAPRASRPSSDRDRASSLRE